MLTQPVDLLKLMLNLLHTINIQERELCVRDFVKYTFNTGLNRDTCEPISFKLYMQYDFSLNDLDHHSRSQCHGKARTCAVILL